MEETENKDDEFNPETEKPEPGLEGAERVEEAEGVETETEGVEATEELKEQPEEVKPKPVEPPRLGPVAPEVPKRVVEEPKKVAVPEKPRFGWLAKLKDFIRECKRVLLVTKKPDKLEFKTIVKVSGLGIVIIGVIGFLVFFIKELFFK